VAEREVMMAATEASADLAQFWRWREAASRCPSRRGRVRIGLFLGSVDWVTPRTR
jgi:hypothetical protein